MTESRTALVTGASRGIGAGIAQRLIHDGIFVIGTSTSEEGVQGLNECFREKGFGVKLTLSDEASVARALEEIETRGKSIDVLINNAGITRDTLVLRMSQEMWNDVIDANLSGLFRVTKPLLRGMMRKRWGRIVNLGSVVAKSGNPGQVNYAAAKAGIEGFTRSLALEVASRGITVNCVAPGFVVTDMTSKLPESVVADFKSKIPVGRIGTVEDIAATVAFLVSEDAGYVTAQTIHVNGGMLPT